MTRPGHRAQATLWMLIALCAVAVLATPPLASGAGVSPLPESDYTMRGACSAPAPGHAGCMALELVPHTAAAQAGTHPLGTSRSQPIADASPTEGSYGLRPGDLRAAYFPGKTELPDAPASEPQTIALVDAYNDPEAEADLGVYDKEFDLPPLHACSGSESGCFEQVSQSGTGALPFPRSETERKAKETICVAQKAGESKLQLKRREEACAELVEAEGWAVEISTDIEVAHAVCQNCRILLVEASTAAYPNLEAGEETAVRLGASEVSNSWGGAQEGSSGLAFDHPGTVITAAAGDDGYLNWTEAEAAAQAQSKGEASAYFVGADYPAASPDVVAVGGTKLLLSEGVRRGETVWNEDPSPEGENQGAGGGGCSDFFSAAPWQQAVPDWSQVGCGSKRAVADVAADGDPYTGVAVYDSVPTVHEEAGGEVVNTPLGWWPIGGTSVASPIVASMFALAGGAHGIAYPSQTLYSHLGSPLLYDVTAGSNGACDDVYTSCTGSLDPLSPLDCGAGALICNATSGYDGPTGVGTPNGIGAFEPSEELVKSSASQGSATRAGPVGTSGGGSSSGQAGGGSGGASPGAGSERTSLPTAPRISALALTANARAALRRGHLVISDLAFSCTLSRATTVRVVLAVQVRSDGHTRWRALPASFTFAAVEGASNRRRLRGSGTLAPGLYRLTLTPADGATRSLAIRVP